MARDLVSGGLFFVSGSCLAFLLATVLPLWWFTTTELEGEMCSCGTGLWFGNVTWGNDITQEHLLGAPVKCSSNTPMMVDGCDAPFNGQAESETKGYIGGVFSILSTLFAAISFGFGFSVLEQQPGLIDVIRFRKGLCWAALAAFLAIICQVTTISVFLSGPLFENLADNFGCHFVFVAPLNSNTLKCHALGPAFGLAVGGCLLCGFSCAMFFLAFKNPHYIDPETGRYSLFQTRLLGARPLDQDTQEHEGRGEYVRLGGDDQEQEESNSRIARNGTSSSSSSNNEAGGGLSSMRNNATDSNERVIYDEPERSGKPCRSFDCGNMEGNRSCVVSFFNLYWMPTLLMMNAAFFVWSNCSTGATVEPNVVIEFPWELRWIGHKLFPGQVDENGVISFKDDVFNFTLITSLRHFWEGKAYGLAFLIGAFSGIWPYVKIFTMMFLWFVPSTEKLRGKLLHWLDVLGKWSLVDAYVLCLMAVAFGFNTDREIAGIKIHVDISVRPGWGVYSFVLATMWSLTMSHTMTWIHRNVYEKREISEVVLKAMSHPPHETLASRAYAPFPRRRRYACSRFGQAVMWFVLFVTLGVTLSGQIFYTFEFRFSGLADLILPEEKRNTAYSLISNGAKLPEACSKGGFLSGGPFFAWFMTIMYFLFAMVVPLAMLVVLAILWGVPMNLQTTKNVFHFAQVLQSWAALDCFLVSIVAAVIEIGGLSEAVIGDAFGTIQSELCSGLDKLPHWMLDDVMKVLGLPPLSPELGEDCALFRVDAVLMEGCFMMLFGVAAWGICTHIIMEFAQSSIDERTRVVQVLANEDHSSIDPYEMMRLVSPEEESGGSAVIDPQNPHSRMQHFVESYDSQDDVEAEAVGNVYLKRILRAQEEGAQRFMGTYFGDCMYGPFPRVWYYCLQRANILYKVDWSQVGFDIHAALLMNMLSQADGNRRSSLAGLVDDDENWEPRSPAQVLLAQQQEQQDHQQQVQQT